ncbi:hypothetical protein [Spirillospora sp. CA-294931]|uniref:hypothetical protein n=1 Tax=Spirillospora sp. CA-294931 TaxID=3240042 RepID=UPI003D904A33
MNLRSLPAITLAVLATVPATAAVAHATAAPAPTTITGFRMVSQAPGNFVVSGRLNSPGMVVKDKALILEFAAKSGGKWYQYQHWMLKGKKGLRTTAGGAFKADYFNGWTVYGNKVRNIGQPNAYWRVRFAGDATVAASTSAVVRDPRIDAHVAGWKFSPRSIRKGSSVTFTGVLVHRPGNGAWKPYRGRVYILGRQKGAKTWYWYARPTTNSKGRFTARFRVYKDTMFSPVFNGDKTHYASNQPGTWLNVR